LGRRCDAFSLQQTATASNQPQQATAGQREIIAGSEWQQQASAAFLAFGKVETPPKP